MTENKQLNFELKDTVSGDELVAYAKETKMEFIIDQLLPERGFMIVAGSTGSGKSLEMLHLLCSFNIKGGGNYHGLKARQCSAIYIVCEDARWGVGDRLKEIQEQYKLEHELRFHFANSLYLDRPDGIDALKEIVSKEREQGNDVKVVIIDSLKYAVSGDYLRCGEAKKWTESVKNLSNELKVSFIFVHHTRKVVAQKGHIEDVLDSDKIKGAKDLIDASESSILMTKLTWVTSIEGKSVRRTEHIIAVVKERHSKVDLGSNYLNCKFDRDKLCWNGEYWIVNGKELTKGGELNV